MDVLIGLQWGDEGKGKIVDFLAPKYEAVARFQGGPNAGHTIEFEGQKHVLHQIPSGIFREGIKNFIGNGVVLDPVILKKEIQGLEAHGANTKSALFISRKAQIIIPTHRLLDKAQEESKGKAKIGSTLKGIGPTYQDKIGRLGLRIGNIEQANFKELYEALKNKHLTLIGNLGGSLDGLEEMEAAFFEAVAFLQEYSFVNSEYEVNELIQNEQNILAEGAQGSLLDIDFGSYPFVTSSNTIVAGACTGLGVAPQQIDDVFGIFKAYCTRVGSGPFPTELFDKDGEDMARIGNEFGATTGRPRRCGWLDLPALKYANMLNGTTQLFMMKADVLNTFEEIKVCTHYKLEDGSIVDYVPFDAVNTKVEPVYKSFKGWNCDLSECSNFEDLPQELQDYVAFIEEATSIPVNVVSIGPKRKETIMREELAEFVS